MIERTLFQPDHQAFADSFRRFIDKEVTPHHAAWEDQGYVAREVWSQAGANGMGADGADYRTILLHYYTGVTIGVIGQY